MERNHTLDVDIDDAWNTLFQESAELRELLRLQSAQIIDFETERKKRAVCLAPRTARTGDWADNAACKLDIGSAE